MSAFADLVRDALQTAFRLAPWPTEPGLRSSGTPGPSSPVLVTGNYDLTVRRLLRSLRGVDAWVVVAPSGGINVWCAAAGGHLSTHQVVTALKTSGIEQQVSHRRAILPQLGATGVLGREVSRRCGWKVRFGPVYAGDLPEYLERGEKKSDAMRHVRFGPLERLEMAAAWAAPCALGVAAVFALLQPAWILPLAALATLMSLAVFFLFDRLPEPRRIVLAACSLAAAGGAVVLAGGSGIALATALLCAGLFTAVLTFDYDGSTPVEGSSFFEQRHWRIRLDPERCRGVYNCWEVCPEACFEKPDPEPPKGERVIELAHDERCIRCGACVVQCPMDALFLEDRDGLRIEPDTIRRYKLNLLGRRAVDAGPVPPADLPSE